MQEVRLSPFRALWTSAVLVDVHRSVRPICLVAILCVAASGCGSDRAQRRLDESAEPFLGVACGVPNSITCDRVGVGVNAPAATTLVMVHVAGRWVRLSPPTDSPGDHLWLGYLRDAGLRHGALDVGIPPVATRWFGTPEVQPPVTVAVFFADGTVSTLTARGFLHPGFG
jgi:hypothetical protein